MIQCNLIAKKMTGDTYSKHLSHSEIVFAGGASSVITRGVCQPLDVLKIRFQLQVEPIHYGVQSKYKSISQAFLLITKEEGASALWKGHIPAQLLSVIYGSAQFWCFEVLRKEFSGCDYKFLVNFGSGAVSGAVATVLSFPFDVVRTRLVAQSENAKVYTGILNSFQTIYKQQGLITFYRGLMPAIVQIAPHSGVQFMCYKLCDGVYRKVFPSQTVSVGPTITGSLVCGSSAGLCAKIAIYPFDLLKKRMQIQGQSKREIFGKCFICSGFIDCFLQTFKHEGILGLFKGLGPSLIKAVCTSALHFSTYELMCKVLSESHYT